MTSVDNVTDSPLIIVGLAHLLLGQLTHRGGHRRELTSAGKLRTKIHNCTSMLGYRHLQGHTGPHTPTFLTWMICKRHAKSVFPSSLTQHPRFTVHFICCSHLFSLSFPFLLLPPSITITISSASFIRSSVSISYLLPPAYMFPLSSHFPVSRSLYSCPSRLQMVLNGRVSERNCLVNNSTGTR